MKSGPSKLAKVLFLLLYAATSNLHHHHHHPLLLHREEIPKKCYRKKRKKDAAPFVLESDWLERLAKWVALERWNFVFFGHGFDADLMLTEWWLNDG